MYQRKGRETVPGVGLLIILMSDDPDKPCTQNNHIM